MITLTKGNWDNLEGKVLIYAKLDNEAAAKHFGTSLVCSYSSSDILNLAEKVGFEDKVDGIAQKIKEFNEMTASKFSKDGIKVVAIPFYSAPIFIEDEKDILIGNHDIVFAREWDRFESCVQAVEAGTRIYALKYMEQTIKKYELDNPHSDKKSEAKLLADETYTAYAGKSLKNVLIQNYVAPIMDAKNRGETERANVLGVKLVHFIQGASFAVDGFELLTLAKRAESKRDYDLIDSYLNKIDAIHLERFEDAAKYRDVIVKAKG